MEQALPSGHVPVGQRDGGGRGRGEGCLRRGSPWVSRGVSHRGGCGFEKGVRAHPVLLPQVSASHTHVRGDRGGNGRHGDDGSCCFPSEDRSVCIGSSIVFPAWEGLTENLKLCALFFHTIEGSHGFHEEIWRMVNIFRWRGRPGVVGALGILARATLRTGAIPHTPPRWMNQTLTLKEGKTFNGQTVNSRSKNFLKKKLPLLTGHALV